MDQNMPHRELLRALLVDDERLARKQLRALLGDFPEIAVVADAASVTEALAAVDTHYPDVVFLDIQMPGASGFDFLQQTKGTFATIFVTAHDRFALRAFEVNGLDYLLKPVEKHRLQKAIERLPLRLAGAPVLSPGARLKNTDYLYVSNNSSARFIPVRSIQYIQAGGPYSEIFTEDGSKWMLLRSMKEWEERLPPGQFARIHRSTLVNLDFVERIEPLANYSYRVSVRGKSQKQELAMSRRSAQALKERFA